MKKASLERAQGLSIWTGRTMSITHVNDVTEDLGLGEGRTNQNFIAKDSASGERFFIRVGSDLPAYGVSRVKEQAAARAVEAAGIGARVIHTELPDVLVCAFIDGRSLTEERTLVSSYLQLDALSAQQALTFQCVKVLATLRETLWGVVAEKALSLAVATVAKERPANPLLAIAAAIRGQ
ncbi:choline ethanolamine kinase [Chrysochromulina tobinii]|uniref:Choline ethanolamine kinase n=1 Tax=Chrysochromulina tobinii TaxID=1460289 RepID=A0A0M0JKV7_9EUKA|nr:choline ethanolamine kinase [Chrysochromulina tobinii]|eukprot:KOO27226.1 choline ethanolamine kinase [Chrysochromulina sp. CCMP291]